MKTARSAHCVVPLSINKFYFISGCTQMNKNGRSLSKKVELIDKDFKPGKVPDVNKARI